MFTCRPLGFATLHTAVSNVLSCRPASTISRQGVLV